MARRTLAESARYVMEMFGSYGLKVNPNSRIGQMCRTFVADDGTPAAFIPETDQGFPTALEAVRDIQQLSFIFDQISLNGLPDDFHRRVKLLLKDSVLPQDDEAKSKGRDTQCEFYVAAICAKGGLKPVFDEKPDLRIELTGQTLGVAVKRCKSLDQFEEHIHKAAKQILGSSFPGIIVCDMSMALNEDNERIAEPWTNRQFDRGWSRMLNKFMDDYIHRIYQWAEGRHVHGVVLLDHRLRRPPGEAWGLESMTHFSCLVRNNQRRQREFSLFQKQFVAGLATPATHTPPSILE